jgi:hypothetical protein
MEFGGIRPPGGTTTATWTGATGGYMIDFWYYEGNETQAQLISNVAPVPLPAAGWMLLAGLGGMAALRRRQKG